MAKQRVKVKPDVIPPPEDKPKTRDVDVKNNINQIETVLNNIIPTEKIDNKKSKSEFKFERHKAFGDLIKQSEISEKVKNGELKWSYYALDGETGYQYYQVLKK
jgi:hypothetical protein